MNCTGASHISSVCMCICITILSLDCCFVQELLKTHNGAVLCDAFEVASPTGDQLEQPLTSDPFSAPVKQPAADFVPGAVKGKGCPTVA